MNTDEQAVRAARQVLDALAEQLQGVLPVLHTITGGVRDAWWDERGREWIERASLLRRSLERDLDAALAAGRAAMSLLDSLAVPDPTPAAATGSRAGGPSRSGPRLPGTEAERIEDADGMRLGTLDG